MPCIIKTGNTSWIPQKNKMVYIHLDTHNTSGRSDIIGIKICSVITTDSTSLLAVNGEFDPLFSLKRYQERNNSFHSCLFKGVGNY